MTEAEWSTATNAPAMLEFLRGGSSERQLRLYAVACCRQIWDLLVEEGHEAVEASERYADGVIGESDLTTFRNKAKVPQQRRDVIWKLRSADTQRAMQAAVMVAWGRVEAWKATVQVAHQAAGARDYQPYRFHLVQANLLRDIFGNPFRPAKLDPAWLRWNDGAISAIAQQIYDDRNIAALPILADALEEAGCTNGDILEHCRGPGPHVRGCWVVDLVLGKE